jgi:hypothetical protein
MLLERQRPSIRLAWVRLPCRCGMGFLATAMVVDRYDEDESGTLAVSAIGAVGLDCEPARKLTTALGKARIALRGLRARLRPRDRRPHRGRARPR